MKEYLGSLVSGQYVVSRDQPYTTYQIFLEYVYLKHFCTTISDELGFGNQFEKRHEPWNPFELQSNTCLFGEIQKLRIGQLSQWRQVNTDNSPFPRSGNFLLETDLPRPNFSMCGSEEVYVKRETRKPFR
jgi:hypothetical protein